MAKAKRAPIDPEQAAADLAAFSNFIRSQEQAERDAKKAARDERRKADDRNRLVKAKEDAAAEVKRLRTREGASAEQKAAADEAYKAALAAVVAAETGEAPAWAPAPAPEAEVEVEVEVVAGAEADVEPDADVQAEAEAEAEPVAGD